MKMISSANVACGFHAGDPHVMRHTVALAKENGVAVGAHPGLPDLMGFGRRDMKVSTDELKDYFVYQIGALKAFVEAAGMKMQHVKPHGALFKMSLDDGRLAVAMAEAAKEVDPEFIVMAPTGTVLIEGAQEVGLRVGREAYADRAYNLDKSLVNRSIPGAVIKDTESIKARIDQLMQTSTVTTIDGQTMELEFESICLHGDTPGAAELIQTIRGHVERLGVTVKNVAQII
jgi:UPF0271 protein